MTRPTRIAQTTKEAKKEYKKNGLKLPEHELRKLHRDYELDQRAKGVREQEERRRAAKKKREEKEKKDREKRRQLGVGLATQLAGYSHTQAKLKSGMEAFLGLKKRKEAEDARQAEVARKLDAIAESIDKEPWDEGEEEEDFVGFEDTVDESKPLEADEKTAEKEPWDDGEKEEDFAGFDDTIDENKNLEAVEKTAEKEPWDGGEDFQGFDHFPDADSMFDDDLDDDTLLELMSDIESSGPHSSPLKSGPHSSPFKPGQYFPPKKLERSHSFPEKSVAHPSPRKSELHPSPEKLGIPPAPKTIEPLSSPKKPVDNSADEDFLRLHGPINKAIEDSLRQLPEPLIELLSTDCSTSHAWTPSLSLLHKLNPVGLPPHRLRIKVGCIVSVLRDLNTSSQLSKSNHLRVLRAENDRLECLVLDGQLEGTKTFLTRVLFHAKYRNEDKSPFQRMQFPIRVSTTFIPKVPLNASIPKRPPEPKFIFKKPAIPPPRPKPVTNPNPTFKLPGLPASKSSKPTIPPPQPQVEAPALNSILDGWDDFLDSGTQIARELSLDVEVEATPDKPAPVSSLDEFGFCVDDLDELDLPDMMSKPASSIRMPTPPKPPPIPSNPPMTRPPPPHIQKTMLKQNPPSHMPQATPKQKTPLSALPNPPPPQIPQPAPKRNQPPRPIANPPRSHIQQSSNLKRKTPPGASNPPPKKLAMASKAPIRFLKEAEMKSFSFSEFGLSTQDADSFFDDDEFSAIAV